MVHESIRIAPFLRVGILDADPVFCGRLKTILRILGVEDIRIMQSADFLCDLVEREMCDLIFVEIAEYFADAWARLAAPSAEGILVVGLSDDRSVRDWLWAIKRGADTILLKGYYPYLLREMLVNLVESRAARRWRIVQFPTRYHDDENRRRTL